MPKGSGRGNHGGKAGTLIADVERRRQMILLEKNVIGGVTNHEQLAAGIGVSPTTIRRMLGELRKDWRENGDQDSDDRRMLRIKQFENIYRQALHSFEKSKQDSEEFTISERVCVPCLGTGKDIEKKTSEPIECEVCGGQGIEEHLPGKYKRCDECKGSGARVEGPNCPECQGKGRIILETTRTKGQAGDPAFLNAARAAVESAAKLDGLFPVLGRMGMKTQQDLLAAGGDIARQTAELYFEAPADQIIRAMAMIDELNQGIAAGTIKKVIDVSATQIPDDEAEEGDEE